MSRHRSQWKLPRGITRGLWDYVHSEPIATDYDEYFLQNRLFTFDEQILIRELERRGIEPQSFVADLGCGTGRALVAATRHGYRGLAIDLSEAMLGVVAKKAQQQQLPIQCLRANLVELSCLADDCAAAAVSLFSTLGMIRGRENRRDVLTHVRRIVQPDGCFVFHVHNYWYNLYDPGGPWWLIGNLCRSTFVRDVEAGDKFFDYRGVPNMFLHVFTLSEIKRELRAVGFRVSDVIPLDPQRHRKLRWPRLLGSLRANGWIVVCD